MCVNNKLCPCGTGQSYVDCCGALHSGARTAATAEQLMRSRYSAFAVSDEDYLLRTWAARNRPSSAGIGIVYARPENVAYGASSLASPP